MEQKSRIAQSRRFRIVSKLQANMILMASAMILMVGFVIAALLFTPLLLEIFDHNLAQGARAQLANELLILHKRFWPAILGGIVLGVCLALKISHRVAGPLYRMRCVIAEIGTGPTPQAFRTRAGDFLGAEAEMLNLALDRLRQRDNRHDQTIESVMHLARMLAAEGRDDLLNILDGDLRRRLEEEPKVKSLVEVGN